mmetsp:Transcript_19596/g.33633  ORF Transcript_19596/g.33633 Transcript_19596/m.33633 type:complete len:221 (+) Transcript_19596:179-841(+)
MGSLLSKPKKPKNRITAHDQAVLDLKVQRDKLRQYQKKIEVVIQREDEVVRELLQQKRKDRALVALKKKKYQQHLLSKADAMIENVEKMVDSIEFAQLETKVLDGLQAGNEALKSIQQELSVEKIEQLLADTADAIQQQQEIEALLSGKLSADDDADVLSQLAQLEAESLEESLPAPPQSAPLKEAITPSSKDVEESAADEPAPTVATKSRKAVAQPVAA